MQNDGHGYFSCERTAISTGARYYFVLDGQRHRSDPCSLWQPEGVTGPSAVVRTSEFQWTDAAWKGIANGELVFYELHVGTFTAAGTFDAIIPRLKELRELGITAIELLPINQFPGDRNWGYDGVLPYAAQHSYGGPQGLQRLVDAAHQAGLAVILDVVYNHFGPENNFIHEFGPYFTDRYKTPWGSAINYDGPHSDAVRDFVLDNVRMWLDEFHIDGLRLDAVHAIYDLGARHILRAIKEVAEEVSATRGRAISIIGESDLNDARIVLPPGRGGHGLDAHWSDDFHHAIHAFMTGEQLGYYADYGKVDDICRTLANPYLFAWNFSAHRGRKHGAPLPNDVTTDRFVVCTQNHDQVGNRAKGDRLSTIVNHRAKLRLSGSLLLLSPYLPLIFMGEEYGEARPFPFFCSFEGKELIDAVREGRQREFKEFVSSPHDVPDANELATFESAKLSWSWPQGSWHAGLRMLYRDLLTARRDWPMLKDLDNRKTQLLPDSEQAEVIELRRGDNLFAYFNMLDRPVQVAMQGKRLVFSSEHQQYGGERKTLPNVGEPMLPFECIVTLR